MTTIPLLIFLSHMFFLRLEDSELLASVINAKEGEERATAFSVFVEISKNGPHNAFTARRLSLNGRFLVTSS